MKASPNTSPMTSISDSPIESSSALNPEAADPTGVTVATDVGAALAVVVTAKLNKLKYPPIRISVAF
ncbi:hypothetical protein PPEP_a2977 [Pseudoalteromonas peptidolytica F12-50-A1]|uniref:Uncharacterized protein n=1 Tax=Pseudoalteromonas peptidolytica F12-50-A1 TaxID=1315280 RepID=A0A8I0MW07_9GAMM|nr:hypothetical protein [Pseudoalteromonas peptidolytica F12-50-A1]